MKTPLVIGARLVDKQPGDLQERFRHGRANLSIDRLIPPGDSLEVIYHYRLSQPGGTNQQDHENAGFQGLIPNNQRIK